MTTVAVLPSELPDRLTLEQATEFFAVIYRGEHHIPSDLREEGNGCWSISHYGELASFDYDELTRYVLLAHELGVRVWLRSGGPRRIRIWISKRLQSSSELSMGHPTIEEAVSKFRKLDGIPWYRAFETLRSDRKS